MVPAGSLRFGLGAFLTALLSLGGYSDAAPSLSISTLAATSRTVVEAQDLAFTSPVKPSAAPNYPAPLSKGLELDASVSTVVRLVGIDLRQGGENLSGTFPALAGDAPLEIVAYWCPEVPITAPIPVVFEFIDAQNILKEQFAHRAGPERADEHWEPGLLYTQRYLIGDFPNVARLFSGQAFLTVGIQVSPRKSVAQTVLQCLEVRIAPSIRQSGVSEDEFRAQFGQGCVRLPFSTRLGLEADCEVKVQDEWQQTAGQLVVVSSMDYTLVGQGEEVCQITVRGENNRETTFSLVAGENTAHSHHDFYSAGNVPHQQAPIFSSQPASYLSQQELPFETHTYVAAFELPGTLGRAQSLELRCTAETSLNILGIALTPK